MTTFRPATRAEVPQVVALLADDILGAGREMGQMDAYLAAFDAMQTEGGNHLLVAAQGDVIIATYQLTFISGLSLSASRRAQIEAVRVHADHRGAGLGAQILSDAETRAWAAGCTLLQLTSNKTRGRALAFYETHGFTPSHIGFKRVLD